MFFSEAFELLFLSWKSKTKKKRFLLNIQKLMISFRKPLNLHVKHGHKTKKKSMVYLNLNLCYMFQISRSQDKINYNLITKKPEIIEKYNFLNHSNVLYAFAENIFILI